MFKTTATAWLVRLAITWVGAGVIAFLVADYVLRENVEAVGTAMGEVNGALERLEGAAAAQEARIAALAAAVEAASDGADGVAGAAGEASEEVEAGGEAVPEAAAGDAPVGAPDVQPPEE